MNILISCIVMFVAGSFSEDLRTYGICCLGYSAGLVAMWSA